MAQSWLLEWSHGRTRVHAGGGAIGRTDVLLDDGRWASPFHEAPWVTRGEAVEPAGMNNLRGDWACLPFGRPYTAADRLPQPWAALAETPLGPDAAPLGPSDHLMHGYGAAADWTLVSHAPAELVIGLDLPEDSPIGRIVRTIRPVPGAAAMDVSVEVLARRACTRPFGFHPNFALRGRPESIRLVTRPYRFGLTHPAPDDAARAAPDTRFTDLAAVRLAAGGTGRFDRLPFARDSEDILQLCGIEGGIGLVDEEAGVAWELTWDAGLLQSCLLWMSNRGRRFPPWNGENLCVGVEPVASAFDLGPAIAGATNPIAAAGIATALRFEVGVPLTLAYRIAGRAYTSGR